MDQAWLSQAPALADLGLAPFVPRAPWWGGDLQTMRNFLVRARVRLADHPHQRLELPLGDGSGDRLSGALGRPAAGIGAKPLVVLLHGLSGEETSFYMRRTAAHLLALGWPVLRLNLRGAGPSRALSRWHYHAGRSEDLGLAFAALPSALVAHGVVAAGYSLGANMLLKFLGEQGRRAPLRAAVAISAPLDLAGTARRLMRRRNALYQYYLLKYMRKEAVAPIAAVTGAERRAILAARSIWEFDDRFSAPRNGFAGATDYYERSAARHYLAGIAVPTLVIHALDDPWIPSEPYLDFVWRRNPNLIPLITARGGHVGFEGGDRRTAWHDLAVARFLETWVSRP
ncbi:MAG TPA: alpha/beta fold hydrolase [Stellaceae bacterium]|nr:alpha/beta fold hydrolase [Stellaceae bacterium]